MILIGSSNWGTFEGDLGNVQCSLDSLQVWDVWRAPWRGPFVTLLGFLPAGGLLEGTLVL